MWCAQNNFLGTAPPLPSASPKKILNGEKRKACHVKVIVVLSPSIFGHLLQNAKICHSWTPHPYEKLWGCVCVCLSEKAGRRSVKCYVVAALLCCDCLSGCVCIQFFSISVSALLPPSYIVTVIVIILIFARRLPPKKSGSLIKIV